MLLYPQVDLRDLEVKSQILSKKCDSLESKIDHTLLKAEATQEQISVLCREAMDYGFASVCVNPVYVTYARDQLAGSTVKVTTVVGFPLGTSASIVKEFEAQKAIREGADEIDMVIHVGSIKSGRDDAVLEELCRLRDVTKGYTLKVILETGLLTEEEKVRGARLVQKAGADFVKTCTGFGGGHGATVEDVVLIRRNVSPEMGIKASGGIRTREFAEALLSAGATRLGMSASVAIVNMG